MKGMRGRENYDQTIEEHRKKGVYSAIKDY